METKKLIPMVQFILNRKNNAPIEDYEMVNENFVNDVIAYAEFLNTEISIDMFVGENAIFEDFVEKEDVDDVFSKTIVHKSGFLNVAWFETAPQRWVFSHGLKRVEDAAKYGLYYNVKNS